jgi:lysophospholipase L1-like esterase
MKTVACLGASIIHGRISYSVVDLLADRLGPTYQLVNAGVNGDLAYNLRQRLQQVVACRPDVAIVLVGTNDVLASMSRRSEARYRRMKNLPERPTRDWYRDNLRAIVAALKSETGASIALCSLPVLGEALDSPTNRRVEEYCAVIAEVAKEEGVPVLPVHEDTRSVVRAERPAGGRPFDGSVLPMFWAMVARYVLGQSFDAISAAAGFVLLTDGIHLNRRGADILAKRFEEFVRRAVG